MPAKDPLAKDSVRNNHKSILALDEKLKQVLRRTRGMTYRFQLKWEQAVDLSTSGVPTVICLSKFSLMRPIFQARDDTGAMNEFIANTNKVRAGISGINYSIQIADTSMPVYTVSVFFVKLKRTAKEMVALGTSPGIFEGSDMVPEKDFSITPSLGVASRQFNMLNKNIFKILHHKRYVLGRRIAPLDAAGGTNASIVTNRHDTTVDKYFKLKHDKILKAPYGNGWLQIAGAEANQEIAGRPYIIIIPQNMTGHTGNATFLLQQVCTLKSL